VAAIFGWVTSDQGHWLTSTAPTSTDLTLSSPRSNEVLVHTPVLSRGCPLNLMAISYESVASGERTALASTTVRSASSGELARIPRARLPASRHLGAAEWLDRRRR
jgi:hypothetical protein